MLAVTAVAAAAVAVVPVVAAATAVLVVTVTCCRTPSRRLQGLLFENICNLPLLHPIESTKDLDGHSA